MRPTPLDTHQGVLAFPTYRAIDTETGAWRTGWAIRPATPEDDLPDSVVLLYTDDEPVPCHRRTLGQRVPLATEIIELYTGDVLETNGAAYVVGFADGSYRLFPTREPGDAGMILTSHLLHACNWKKTGTRYDAMLKTLSHAR